LYDGLIAQDRELLPERQPGLQLGVVGTVQRVSIIFLGPGRLEAAGDRILRQQSANLERGGRRGGRGGLDGGGGAARAALWYRPNYVFVVSMIRRDDYMYVCVCVAMCKIG